jgi:hypothetical protein
MRRVSRPTQLAQPLRHPQREISRLRRPLNNARVTLTSYIITIY